jgi:hypothetical protein
MSLLPKFIYPSKVTPVKIPTEFSGEIDRLELQFTWKKKEPRIAKDF